MSSDIREGTFTLRLMGHAALLDGDGREVRLPTRKALLVLAMLVVDEERVWLRHDLAHSIWPESEPAKARGSLRSALNALRAALQSQTLETRDDFVSIRARSISCDATGDELPSGEFMPGFDTDWVIEHRLRLRGRNLEAALADARFLWAADRRDEALAAVEKACLIDPLDKGANATRVRILSEMGKVGDALAVSESFEIKVMRELERALVEEAQAELHPLAKAAEWVLERNPREALDLLASTPTQWFAVPLSQAVDVHVRVLAANPTVSVAKSVVEAQNFFLQSLGGQTDAVLMKAGQSYERAMGTDDTQVAVRIAAAMAFSYLAKGRFALALKVGRMQEQIAISSSDQLVRERASFNLGVLEFHGGEPEKGAERLQSKLAICESIGAEEGAAMVRVNTVNALLQYGRIDEAAASLAFARSFFEQTRNMRMLPWVSLGEALVSEVCGDLEESRDALLRIRALGSKAVGYSVAAVAEDRLIRIFGRLGQWDEAAEAWARARALRVEYGAVRTMWERAETLEAAQALKEHVGEAALQAAFRKVTHPSAGLAR